MLFIDPALFIAARCWVAGWAGREGGWEAGEGRVGRKVGVQTGYYTKYRGCEGLIEQVGG